jgi:hypothetical protein
MNKADSAFSHRLHMYQPQVSKGVTRPAEFLGGNLGGGGAAKVPRHFG